MRVAQDAGEFDRHFAADQKCPALSQQLEQELPGEAGRAVVGAHENVHIEDKSQRIGR